MQRIGILGLTHPHANAYILGVLRHAELAAIWDEDQPELAENCSIRYACPPCSGLHSFLSVDLDAVVIGSEPGRQYGYLRALNGTGIPVLCEGPMALSGRLPDDLRIYVSCPVRYAPALQEASRRLKSPAGGDVLSVMISIGYGSYRQNSWSCIHDAQIAAGFLLQQELALLGSELRSSGQEGMEEGVLLLKSSGGTIVGIDLKQKLQADCLVQEDWRIDIIMERERLHLNMFAQGGMVTDMSSEKSRKVYWGDSPFDDAIYDFIRSYAAARQGGIECGRNTFLERR